MSLCTAAHPLYTRFTNMFGASISETTMRPNPKVRQLRVELEASQVAGVRARALGFGRIVASEIEAPNMLVNMV